MPCWENQESRKSEVIVWLLELFFMLFGVKNAFLHTCTDRFCIRFWGFGPNVHPDIVTVVDSGFVIDVWFEGSGLAQLLAVKKHNF